MSIKYDSNEKINLKLLYIKKLTSRFVDKKRGTVSSYCEILWNSVE